MLFPRPKGLLSTCHCGGSEAVDKTINNIPVLECLSCGVQRQRVDMDAGALSRFYENRYYKGIYSHNEKQDRAVAELRMKKYNRFLHGKILDIGSGNGAFVEACRESGLDAWGVEIAPVGKDGYTYRGPLEGHHFPTEWANCVTLHDVLEHVIDPVGFLKEVHRIVSHKGTIVVDLPDFHAETGKHHWKKIEHLWMWTDEQFRHLLKQCGLLVKRQYSPVLGKQTYILFKHYEPRKTILVPPGVGDIYWVMTKIRSFAKKEGLGIPEIWIDAPDERKRSLEFVRSIPFVKAGGYHSVDPPRGIRELFTSYQRRKLDLYRTPEREEAIHTDGRHIFQGFQGFSYYFCINGSMDAGVPLHEIEPELETEWDIPMFISLKDQLWAKRKKQLLGDYVVCAFFSTGFYKKWIKDLSAKDLVRILQKIAKRTKKQVILTGAAWDLRSSVTNAILNEDFGSGMISSIVGETTFGQYMALLKEASGCIGFPAGNTLLGPALGTKTALIWNDHFPESMHKYSCRHDTGLYKHFNSNQGVEIIEKEMIEFFM